jgi:hypothetical protein
MRAGFAASKSANNASFRKREVIGNAQRFTVSMGLEFRPTLEKVENFESDKSSRVFSHCRGIQKCHLSVLLTAGYDRQFFPLLPWIVLLQHVAVSRTTVYRPVAVLARHFQRRDWSRSPRMQ